MSSQDLKTEEAIIQTYQKLVEEQRALASASLDRQHEFEEYNLVIRALKPLDGKRKCSQLVGNVLVARTIEEVLPNLEDTRSQISALLGHIEKQFSAKSKEVADFEQKYKIRMKNRDAAVPSSSGDNKSGGVLVSN
jgi:prefoldin subunit 2